MKTKSSKDATMRDAAVRIAANCDNVLALLQVVALKSLQLLAEPLSLQADKRTNIWFCQWKDINLKHYATL